MMIPAIEKRRSCRSYTEEHIKKETMDRIRQIIMGLNMKSGLNFAFEEDGSTAFSKTRFTYGLFRNVRSIILVKGDIKAENLREKCGYFGENLILELTDMNLGTCWVGGAFDRKSLSVPGNEELVAVIITGYEDKPSLKDRITGINHTKRRPLKERITSDTELPEWINKGMEAVVPAPSAMNRQKPHFTYRNGILTASVEDTYAMDLIDLGIAKLHFEKGAAIGKFRFGNGAEFERE